MKPLLFSIGLLLALISTAQTTDTLQTKLSYYKDMYSKGMIDSSEYKQLRQKALGINQDKPVQQPQTIIITKSQEPLPKLSAKEIEALQNHGSIDKFFGVVFILGGQACWITDIGLSARQQGLGIAPQIVLAVFGGVLTGTGIGLVVTGAKQTHLYKRYKSEVALNITPSGAGLAYKF